MGKIGVMDSAQARAVTRGAAISLILAGGQSRRMGQDKALIALGSETLLQRTCRLALACTPTVYVITPWPDRYRPLLPPAIHLLDETQFNPSFLGQGPLIALTQALSVIFPTSPPAITPNLAPESTPESSADPPPGAGWCLALACDLPNLAAAPWQSWMAHLPYLSAETLAYLPRHQGRWHPLCGFYRCQCLTSWQRYIAAGGRSFQGWLAQQTLAAIPQVEAAWLTNLNTTADVATWQQGANQG